MLIINNKDTELNSVSFYYVKNLSLEMDKILRYDIKKEQMFARGASIWQRKLKQYLYVRNVDMRVPNGRGNVFAGHGTLW
jgi:hypothetical protein